MGSGDKMRRVCTRPARKVCDCERLVGSLVIGEVDVHWTGSAKTAIAYSALSKRALGRWCARHGAGDNVPLLPQR